MEYDKLMKFKANNDYINEEIHMIGRKQEGLQNFNRKYR